MAGSAGLATPALSAVAATSASYTVRCEYDVATVVAGITRYCAGHRLPAVFAAHVATAGSELANNLWLYAERGGAVHIRVLERAGHAGLERGVELVAEDDGPGIADLALALREGYSSGGGMGCGLSGVQRLMDQMQVDSAPGRGTRVVASKWQPRLR